MKYHALCFLLILIFYSTFAFPASQESSGQAISPWAYQQLEKIEKLMGDEAYGEALKKLQKMLPEVDGVAYEKAIVLRTLASVYALQGHYAKAAAALEKSLATDALTDGQKQQALRNLAQLYLGLGQYQQAVKILEPWLAQAKSPSGEDFILLANAYAQLKQYRKALPYVKKAIAHSQKPVESWLQLELALHYELKEYAACAKVLKGLVRYFPNKKDYWRQLASIYQQLEHYPEALAVKELAYRSGFMATNSELMELVNLFLYLDTPFKAARLLEKELAKGRVKGNSKNWELLANAWTQAREYAKAAQALEKAAELNDRGELYYRLGRIYVEQEAWSEAYSALRRALAKGGLKEPGNAYVLFGMSCHELHFKEKAQEAFAKAANYKKTAKIAQQWLNYITSPS